MKPGPRPTPTNLLKLRGSRLAKTRKGEPKAEIRIPSPPPHLDKTAKTEWRRITKHLKKSGLITDLDRALLAAYCSAYSCWVETEKNLKETGLLIKTKKGNVIQNPWLAIRNKFIEQMSRIGAEFGMTPSARSRLSITPPAKGVDRIAELRARRTKGIQPH